MTHADLQHDRIRPAGTHGEDEIVPRAAAKTAHTTSIRPTVNANLRRLSWRGDHTLLHGAPAGRLTVTAVLLAAIYGITLYAFITPTPPGWLTTFPADKALFSTVEGWLDAGFEAAYEML